MELFIQAIYNIYLHDKYHGPFTAEEIAALLRQKKITTNDFVYDAQFCCIFFIGDLKIFENFLPASPNASSKLTDSSLLIFKNEEITGPYTVSEVGNLISCKQISIFDFYSVYSDEQYTWKRIKEGELFQKHLPLPPQAAPESKNRATKNFPLSNSIIRKFPRAPYSARTTVEWNNLKIIGTCTVLSVGGCYIEMKVEDLKVGGEISIHISPDIVPLNIKTIGKITSINRDNFKGVGIQFIKLNEDTKREIQNFVTKYVSTLKDKN